MAVRLHQNNLRSFVESFDNFIFDCDGVLWVHAGIVPGVPELLQSLRKLGKKVFFVTNNNTKTREQFLEKFSKYGIQASHTEIYTSAYSTAYYIKNIMKCNKKVYMIGGKGLSEELTQLGIPNIGYGPDCIDEGTDVQYDDLEVDLDPEVGTVACGFDQFISVKKYIKASTYIVNRGCNFIATNMDDRLPTSNGITMPGTGCMVSFLATATRKQPIVAGKPARTSFDCIVHKYNIDPSRTLMVGDRLDTDVLYGHRCGTKALLVLSGCTTLEDVDKAKRSSKPDDQEKVPDFYLPSIADLLPAVIEMLNES
ncbi:glycerol-3-phosphate phosphatase-like [Nematostella vectensis]|uniref:glycerol-3-phosphate phosphatase-like n=1 Tax=Nematostella vectensis TaxID=45351 RepID=UPI0020775926|nr:glycerol-3-phosphate phosphatase-like [Nematostella vectensis]